MKGGKIICGTRFGEIWVFEGQSETRVMNGHGTGDTWGLAIDKEGNALSSGDDNKLLYFDAKQNKVVSQGIVDEKKGRRKKLRGGASTLSLLPPNQQSRAVDINPLNGHVAMCTNDGQIHIR